MPNFVYVDNSNVWIEGMHVAAVQAGMVPDIWEAQRHQICDHSWRIDFGRLLEFVGGERKDMGRAVLYGSKPPPNDSLWKAAESLGFEVVVYERNIRGKEKKVDTKIATDITADSFELMNPKTDEISLVAGDADYVPTIDRLRTRGLRFDVCFWDHASQELKDACTRFVSLNVMLEYLRLNR